MASQILAAIIFVVMFIFIVWDKFPRHWVTLICGALVMVFVFGITMHSPSSIIDTLNVQSIVKPGFWITSAEGAQASKGINWETIIFIAGMMIMVESMARVGFFRWLCLRLAKLVKYKATYIFLTFMVMSFVLSMFIDSITVILFLAAVTIELSRLLGFDPVSFIIAEIFCANLGGSATMCGDPPNIIIGTSLGYTFSDFAVNTGLIACVALVFTLVFFYLCFKKELKKSEGGVDTSNLPNPSEAITDKKGFIINVFIFLLAVVLLITHASTGLTVSFIGVLIAAVSVITSGKHALSILKKVDYKTLLFFVGLFIVVSGLEETGVLKSIADLIGKVCNGNLVLIILVILWVSAVASAFVDNIPFAATMLPVIKTLAVTQGVELSTLAWTLSIGADIGGSATPIGASANVVGTSVASKNGHKISWGKYCRYSAPATVMVIAISMVCLILRYV